MSIIIQNAGPFNITDNPEFQVQGVTPVYTASTGQWAGGGMSWNPTLREIVDTSATSFAGTVVSNEPTRLQTTTLNQAVDGDITLSRWQISFTGGFSSFSGTQSPLAQNIAAISTDGVTWNLSDIDFINLGETEFGMGGGFAARVKIHGDSTFDDIRFSAFGDGTWFVNMEVLTDSGASFSNFSFSQGVLNTPRDGVAIGGLSFDGTTRAAGTYTLRWQENTGGNVRGLLYSSDFPGTYTGTSRQIESFATAAADSVWSMNNRYENATIQYGAGQASADSTPIHEGYTLNLQARQSFTEDTFITDTKLIGLPAGTFPMPANFSFNLGNPSALSTTASSIPANGMFLRVDTDTPAFITGGAVPTSVTKALNYETGDLVDEISFSTKSYTHDLAYTTQTFTAPDMFELVQVGDDLTFEYERTSFIEGNADINLNDRDVDAAETAVGAGIATANDLYPMAKRYWYEADAITAALVPSISGGIFTTTQALSFDIANSYAAGTLSVVAPTNGIAAGDSVNGLNFTGALDADNIDFTTATWSGGITTDGAVTNVEGTLNTAITADTIATSGDVNVADLSGTITFSADTMTEVVLVAGDSISFTDGVTLNNCTLPDGLVLGTGNTGTVNYDPETAANSYNNALEGAGSLHAALTTAGYTPNLVVPDITITLDGNLSVADVRYRIVFSGATADKVGAVGFGVVEVPITFAETSNGVQTYRVILAGAGINTQYTPTRTFAEGDYEVTASLNPFYAGNGAIIGGLVGTHANSLFQIAIPTGYTGLETGRTANASILALKSSDEYTFFIREAGDLAFDIVATATNNFQFTRTSTHGPGIVVLAGTGVANILVQGAQFRTTTTAAFSLYSADQEGFRTAIVTPLTLAGVTVGGTLLDPQPTVTTALVPDVAIDYGNVGASVEAAIGEANLSTESDVNDLKENQEALANKVDLGTVKSASYSVTIPNISI